eukprot:4767768-Pyramimonas_sp.AAC.1
MGRGPSLPGRSTLADMPVGLPSLGLVAPSQAIGACQWCVGSPCLPPRPWSWSRGCLGQCSAWDLANLPPAASLPPWH